MTQRKRDPLRIEDEWREDEALAVIVGGDAVLARIRQEFERQPDLEDRDVADVLRELAAVPDIGRAAAVRYVAARVYRAHAGDPDRDVDAPAPARTSRRDN